MILYMPDIEGAEAVIFFFIFLPFLFLVFYGFYWLTNGGPPLSMQGGKEELAELRRRMGYYLSASELSAEQETELRRLVAKGEITEFGALRRARRAMGLAPPPPADE
jgi:hypothetical protein